MIEIKEMKTKKELKQFIKFQFQLYKNEPNWVPPIINDELASMQPETNPVFKNATAQFFIAYKSGKAVGRIAAIINHVEIEEQQRLKMRFGWFDVIDDIDVTKALLGTVEEIGNANNLAYTEGPVGFSNMEKAGILIEGFEYMNTMVTWYNFPYYQIHFEKLGYTKAAEWVEYQIHVPSPEDQSQKIKKVSDMIIERYDLQTLHFKTNKDIFPYVNEMFSLLNNTYKDLSTFVPIKQYQIDHYKEKYIKYIHPEFLKCIADSNGKLIAFAITMPSFSKALKKANGKLFPFGFMHLLKAKKNNTQAAFYLIGVDPEYQKKGVAAVIFQKVQTSLYKNGVRHVETNPELEENLAIQQMWKNYKSKLHKRRRTYKKNL